MKTLQTKNQKGFTLIELLVVIAIIGLLASVVLLSLNSARARSRDARRVADIAQMRSALELYLNDNGTYASTLNALSPSYINPIPTAPNPADGTCSAAQNTYTYTPVSTGYTLTFCLGSTAGQYGTGARILTPAGVQ